MSDSNAKRVISEISRVPSAYTDRVRFTQDGGDAELRYTYEQDGSMIPGGLRFRRVRAFRFRAEAHCTAWYFGEAYDALAEVEQSDWVRELKAVNDAAARWEIHHYLIYLDGDGAHEFAAESFEWISERSATSAGPPEASCSG